jgi:hypothetical protein
MRWRDEQGSEDVGNDLKSSNHQIYQTNRMGGTCNGEMTHSGLKNNNQVL